MEWWLLLISILLAFIAFLITGLPVAFVFGIINITFLSVILGPSNVGFVSLSALGSISGFVWLCIPLFLLMGYIVCYSGLGETILNKIEIIFHGVPFTLSVTCVATGALFGALMGASIASTALLGTIVISVMMKKGYPQSLILGPVLGSGTLANLIPPSVGAVLIGTLASISVSKLLVAGIIPGIISSTVFILYILILGKFKYSHLKELSGGGLRVSLMERMIALRDLLPFCFPIFLVTGIMYLGLATPTEAAATGALGTFMLAVCYRKLKKDNLKRMVLDSSKISCMIFMIVIGSKAYSQIISMSGVGDGIGAFVSGSGLPSLAIIILMYLFVILFGCFVDQTSVIFICGPILIPIVKTIHMDPMVFGITFSMLVALGGITPPFGLNLFALKGVCPPGIAMHRIYNEAVPYCLLTILNVGLVLAFPFLATTIPNLMK